MFSFHCEHTPRFLSACAARRWAVDIAKASIASMDGATPRRRLWGDDKSAFVIRIGAYCALPPLDFEFLALSDDIRRFPLVEFEDGVHRYAVFLCDFRDGIAFGNGVIDVVRIV